MIKMFLVKDIGSVIIFIKNTIDISEQNICNGKHSKNKYIHNYNKLLCKNIENISQNYHN